MGRTYYARSKSVEDFDVNVSGAILLGIIHRELKIPILHRDWSKTKLTTDVVAQCIADEETFPNTLFSATKRQAQDWSGIIAAASDKTIKKIRLKTGGLYGGTDDEFVGFVRDWQKFLSTCGGYEVE